MKTTRFMLLLGIGTLTSLCTAEVSYSQQMLHPGNKDTVRVLHNTGSATNEFATQQLRPLSDSLEVRLRSTMRPVQLRALSDSLRQRLRVQDGLHQLPLRKE
ncbi:MAG: hypothetical protein ACJ74Y_08680 [Bryobacteraceae bacterium]